MGPGYAPNGLSEKVIAPLSEGTEIRREGKDTGSDLTALLASHSVMAGLCDRLDETNRLLREVLALADRIPFLKKAK
jgi:hypothetical protein